jgi:hypothetical protein
MHVYLKYKCPHKATYTCAAHHFPYLQKTFSCKE